MHTNRTRLGFSRRTVLVFRIIFTSLLLGIIAFIFTSSGQDIVQSRGSSSIVEKFLNELLSRMGFSMTLSMNLVRKLAHVVEYFMLGFCMMMTLRAYTSRVLAFSSWPLLLGLLIAVQDEYLQTFVAGRTGQMSDVLIDFASILMGAFCAHVLLLLIWLIWRLLHRKKVPCEKRDYTE